MSEKEWSFTSIVLSVGQMFCVLKMELLECLTLLFLF